MPRARTELPDLRPVAREVVEAAAKGLFQSGLLVEGRAREIVTAERFATGRLGQSIHTQLLPPEGAVLVVAVAATEPYAPFVEFDTRPHVAPFKPFVHWARVKQYRGVKVTARQGWLAVKRRGTKGIHFMERALSEKRREAVKLVAEAIRGAVSRYAR